MTTYAVEIIMEGTVVRFDLFGEVHDGRFVAFFDRDTAMQMARKLGQAASQLPPGRQQPAPDITMTNGSTITLVQDFKPEDLA